MRHSQITGTGLHISKIASGTNNPIGMRTPAVIGEAFWETNSKRLWISEGLTDQDWYHETKEIFFGSNDMIKVPENGSTNYCFIIPDDFYVFTELKLIGRISGGASGPNKNIDYDSKYGKIGEKYNKISESLTTPLYDLSGEKNNLYEFDITSVFTQLNAGHICFLKITHNSIGGPIYYYGIKLKYY